MRIHRKEFEVLKKARSTVKTGFPRLGLNKKQELIRLIYEISKRERKTPESILKNIDSLDFHKIKDALLKRRFPSAYLHDGISKHYLPSIKLGPDLTIDLKKRKFYPKKIFVEKNTRRSHLINKFKISFPKAKISEIESLKYHLSRNRKQKIQEYNNRLDTVFITKENYDFFKKCPCTKKSIGCGYHIFNLSFGCIYECTYCYLQEYANIPGLIFPSNIDNFFRAFDSYKKPRMRIGTGEFSDSLMLDQVTEYSLPLVDFFRKHENIIFEFKTKSKNIDNILKARHSGNIVISWSLNPQSIIDENEFFSTSLDERIASAKRCVQAGYKTGFHFDPVVHFNGWSKEYGKVINLLFDKINPNDIAWISVGTFRFKPEVKKIIEMRFPQNKILDEELLPDFDNKLRYPYKMRHDIYKDMLEMLSKRSKNIPIYLCMEDVSMWRNFKKYLSLP